MKRGNHLSDLDVSLDRTDKPQVQDGKWMSVNANGAEKFKEAPNPMCPHCGFVKFVTPSDKEIIKEGTHKVECFFCEIEYTVVAKAVTVYSTGPSF